MEECKIFEVGIRAKREWSHPKQLLGREKEKEVRT